MRNEVDQIYVRVQIKAEAAIHCIHYLFIEKENTEQRVNQKPKLFKLSSCTSFSRLAKKRKHWLSPVSLMSLKLKSLYLKTHCLKDMKYANDPINFLNQTGYL